MARCDDICARVVGDMLYNCDNKSVGGIVQTVKLVNRCSIVPSDWTINRTVGTGSGSAGCAHEITGYTGTDVIDLAGVTVQGIPGKRLLNASFTSSNTDFGWYYTHLVNLFGQGLTHETICNIKALGEGAELVAFVEQNFKGEDNLDAFLVFGWDAGLKLGDLTFDTNENNGNAVIPITSLDPDLEPYPPMFLNFGDDYAQTKAFFDSL